MSRRRIPELSLAVLAVREAAGESQEIFARRLGTTATTISRIERGLQAPASFGLLNRLESVARGAGLVQEASLFDEARLKVRFNAYRGPETVAELTSLPAWRLTIAVRLAAAYFPETLPEVEKALNPALAIVDAVLRSTDELDYRRLEGEVFSLAENKTLEELKRSPMTIDDREEH